MIRTLTLLATAAGVASALELGEGFALGGFLETSAEAAYRQANAPGHSLTNPGRSETALDSRADGVLRLGWRDEDVTARLDLVLNSEPQFENTGHAWVEQAYIDWRTSPILTLRAGRFQTTWIGWEGFHTPDLWRVRHSAAWDWNVQNHSLRPNRPFVSDGVALRFADPGRTVGAEFYVVDDVLGDGPDTRPADKALGASFWLAREGLGRIELGLAFDARSTASGTDALGQTRDSTPAAAIDLNADLTALQDQGWFFAAEVQLHRHPDLMVGDTRYGNDAVALAMANYAFTPTVSATLMVDVVDRGLAAPDNEIAEAALALLTQPTRLLRANFEVFVWRETADNADIVGAAGVLLLNLP